MNNEQQNQFQQVTPNTGFGSILLSRWAKVSVVRRRFAAAVVIVLIALIGVQSATMLSSASRSDYQRGPQKDLGPRMELAEKTPDGPGIAYTQYGGPEENVYRWRFLPNGPRLEIDRHDGMGFVSLLAAIRSTPERTLRDQGCAFVPYEFLPLVDDLTHGYKIIVDGPEQKRIVRERRTRLGETFTESWTLPTFSEGLMSAPRGNYFMNGEGASVAEGCTENLWRLRLSYEGIAEITKDARMMTSIDGTPLSTKNYRDFSVSVGADSQAEHTFNEYLDRHRAEVVYIPKGTSGTRSIDQRPQ